MPEQIAGLASKLDEFLNRRSYSKGAMDEFRRVIQELGATKDARACAPLIKVLEKHPVEPDWDSDPGLWAMEALGEIADEQAAEPLKVALIKAKYAGRIGAAQAALAKIGTPAVEPLLERIDSRRVIGVLGVIGDERAAEPLYGKFQEWQQSPRKWNRWERVAAMEALGRLGYTGARDSLLAALADEDSVIRRGATFGLGWLGEPQAIGPLLAYAQDGHRVDAAVEVLEHILERYPQNIGLEELRTLATLPKLRRQPSAHEPGSFVDTSRIKTLASLELIRRRR